MIYQELISENKSLTSNDCDSNYLEIYKAENKEEIKKDYYATGSVGHIKNYFKTLPVNIVVHSNPQLDYTNKEVSNVNKHLKIFLSTLENVLINNKKLIDPSISFPTLIIKWLDDKSILIEWIFKDFRIGFTIEPKIEDSGWYLVSNRNLEEYNMSGLLSFKNLDLIINKVLFFALSNL